MNGALRADFDLARFLAPTDVDTFQHKFWEKHPLVIRRDDPLYYRELLSLEGFDEILSTSSLRSNDIRIVRDGHETPLSTLTASQSAALGLEQVYAQYREGSTIVLPFVHERWKPLTRLCATLSEELSAGFQVNAYLTPRNAKGLTKHYDTHDVFVAQLEGSKHWRLFDSPERLPLPSQHYQDEKLASATLLQELDLNAGDLLYVPRGFVHEVFSEDSMSLHLTVGVLPITWAEVILAAVGAVLESNSRFRESLPPGFARDEVRNRAAETQLTELLDVLLAEIDPQSAIMDATERAWLGRNPILDGHLLDLEAELSVSPSTLVWRRPEMQWRLTKDGGEVYLHFHGKRLEMPSHVEADLQFIGETDAPFTAGSLPGSLDEEGRLVLIRRLLREGFLTASPPSQIDKANT